MLILRCPCRPPSTTTISNPDQAPRHRAGKDEGPPQEYVVLLADQYLLELPLEALQCLQVEPIVSLTRDVSVQMLYHRMFVETLGQCCHANSVSAPLFCVFSVSLQPLHFWKSTETLYDSNVFILLFCKVHRN